VDSFDRLELYETRLLLSKVAGVGETGVSKINIRTGSRILVTLRVVQIDPGTTLNIYVEDTFSIDDAYDSIDTIATDSTGVIKRVYTDFNSFLQFRYSVIGSGTATFKVAVVVFDNASSTRIENAQISVNLDHQVDVLGHYDSVRVGDGTREVSVNSDNSINVNTYERLLELVAASKFLTLSNPDSISTSVVGDTTTLEYVEDNAIVGHAILRFVDKTDWDVNFIAYINDDDGSFLLDDNDEPLLLE
jgi:hypothetical protein